MSSRRTVAALAATVSIGGAISAGQVADASSHTSAWAATATQAVSFNGLDLGKVASSKELHLAIGLTPRHAAAMTSAMHALYRPSSSSYHHFLSPAGYRAKYAPTKSAVTKVTSYLRSQGFTSISVSGNRQLISADATAAHAQSAFHTTLANFKLGKNTVFGNTSAAMVPSALSGIVSAVIGLNDLPISATPLTAKPAKKAGPPDIEGGLTPKQFQTTYDAKGAKTGKKVPIALLTQGAPKPVVKSLRFAERKNHFKKVPVKIVRVGPQQHDTSGADEFDMDTQVSSGVAGSVKKLYMYNIGSLLDSEIVADFDKFVSDDKAVAMSASIGGCEINSYLDGSELATDVAMQQAAMQGQSLFASSGDNGDACMYVAAVGAPAGVPGVNWPASGTFTTAVGGTSLVTDKNGNRISELAWAGSGGGVSDVENPGWWTAATDPATTAEYLTGGRAVPDVALDADPNVATPAIIYVGKKVEYVGGTSLSSPMMLGFWARLEAAHHKKLGLASIPLYKVFDKVNPGVKVTAPVVGLPVIAPNPAPKKVPGFTDIVLGTNGVYPATPGYDLTTGLGAPDVKKLTKVIDPHKHKKSGKKK